MRQAVAPEADVACVAQPVACKASTGMAVATRDASTQEEERTFGTQPASSHRAKKRRLEPEGARPCQSQPSRRPAPCAC